MAKTKHNYSKEYIYYANKKEEEEAKMFGVKECFMNYDVCIGMAPGSTNNEENEEDNSFETLSKKYKNTEKKLVRWSDIRWRYLPYNIKIFMTSTNKVAVFNKLDGIATFNNSTTSNMEKMFDDDSLTGRVYLFSNSEGKKYIGWSHDYSNEPECYEDRYEYREISEREFLGDKWVNPIGSDDNKSKAELDEMAKDLNISPQSDPDAIKSLYERKQNKKKSHDDKADAMSYAVSNAWSKMAVKQAAEESLFSKFNKLQKETTMNKETTVEVKINGTTFVSTEAQEEEVEKTDLEQASKWVTKMFNEDGDLIFTNSMTPKEAKKLLPKPDYLGWTSVSYKKAASSTTDIPVRDLEV